MQQKNIRLPWVDYLRGFITLLVVAHHSSLAYTTFAHFNKAAYNSSTHPIVDAVRWRGLDIFEDFNDVFFMSLMFLISGMFVVKGLQKGRGQFIRDRFYRLFVPFAVGVIFLMPLAYYPAYLLAYQKNDVKAYLVDFVTVERWPVGPPWFIWVLFLFNLVFAWLYRYTKEFVNRAGNMLSEQQNKPLKIFLMLYAITWLLYMPMVVWVGAAMWTGIGPFAFQVSRFFLYFGYFSFGAVIGSRPLNEGVFNADAKFSKSWIYWLAGCILAYTLLKLSEAPINSLTASHTINEVQARLIYRTIWTLSCTLSCIAFLTLFKRFVQHTSRWWQSLSENAYIIYLVHYIFVLWCQYALLNVDLPAVVKFIITFITAVTSSWVISILLQKIPVIKKYV